LLLSIIK